MKSASTQQPNTLFTGTHYADAGYGDVQLRLSAGICDGTAFNFTFNNYAPDNEQPFGRPIARRCSRAFRARRTQHLLQGFGWGVNGRFVLQAKNDRRITDSAFRAAASVHRDPGGEHLLGAGERV